MQEQLSARRARRGRLGRAASAVSGEHETALCEIVHGRSRPLRRGAGGTVYPGCEEAPGKSLNGRSHARRVLARLLGAFLPERSSVTQEYWQYAGWRFAQRVASSALGVLSTQQLLFALGIGTRQSLPTAAGATTSYCVRASTHFLASPVAP